MAQIALLKLHSRLGKVVNVCHFRVTGSTDSSLSGVATSKANDLNKLDRFVEKNPKKSRKTSNRQHEDWDGSKDN